MSSKKIVQILIVLICVGVLLFGVFVKPKRFFLPEKTDRPDYVFEKIHLKEYVKGVKTMSLSADRASFDRDSGQLRMQALDAVFFITRMPPMYLKSPTASLQLGTNIFSLQHPDVRTVLSGRAFVLRARTAEWQADDHVLRADGQVRMMREGLTLFGESVSLDQRTGYIRFSGQAKARWIFE